MEEGRRSKLDLQIDSLYSLDGSTSIHFGTMLQGSITVAIKTIECETPEEATLALNEGRCQMQLDHPNICKLFDVFMEPRPTGLAAVLVLEKLENDLRHEIDAREAANNPWTEPELVSFLKGLASALSFAERKGIAHRDIKPENIFMSQDNLKIGDFGLSSQYMSTYRSNYASNLPGTLPYFSPELRNAKMRLVLEGTLRTNIDYYKSDVYSLGLVCVHMALLRIPEGMQDLTQLEKEIPGNLRQMGNKYPQLSKIIGEMMKIDPRQRPTFTEVTEMLDSIEYPPESAPDFPLCCICRLPIDNNSWQYEVPSQLRPYSSMFSAFCGLECLETHHKRQDCSQLCVVCGVEFKSSSAEAVRLECGHSIHSKECVFSFLKKITVNFSERRPYLCPSCKAPVPGIEECFDSRSFAEMKKKAYTESCHFCHTDEDLYTFPRCLHIVCKRHQLTVMWATKCPFCSRWGKIVRFGILFNRF